MAKQIKVGMDAKRAFCNYRGLGNYSRLLVEGLLRWAPNEIDLFLMTSRKSLPEFKQWPSEAAQVIQPQGLAQCFPEIWRGYGQQQVWSQLGLNIYHGLSHELPWGIKRGNGPVRTLVTVHDLIFIRHPELYPPWDRWTYLKKVQHACEAADSIIAISEQTKIDLQELLKIPEERIKVLYQAIHPRYYKAERPVSMGSPKTAPMAAPMAQPYFLYVGAFEERKNLLRLIRAFAQTQKDTQQQLVLIGKGGLEKPMRALIASLGLESQVKILTAVSSQDLPLYYEKATALLYPSLFEGFGLPIVEALMSETLVLTSKGSCFPESGGPSSFYIDPLDENEMAQSLLTMAKLSPEERAERLRAGAQHAQKFHWQTTTSQLLAHYQKVSAS